MAYHKDHNAVLKDPNPSLPSAVPTSDYVIGTLDYSLLTQTINTTFNNESDWYDDYDYDYDASISNLPLAEVVPVGIVYGLTLLLGVLGNALVIFSIARYRRMQSVTNIFLTSLATADLLLVVLCVPIKFAKWVAFTWQFGEFLCKAVHYLMNVSVICSVLTLTAMSMERYYAIVHPMKAKYLCTRSRARKVLAFIWFCSLGLAIPIIFGQIHKEVGHKVKAYWCVREWPLPLHNRLYHVGMLLLIFAIPLIIITFAYVNIAIELWIMTSQRATMRATQYEAKPEYHTNVCYTNGNVPRMRFKKRKKANRDDNQTRKQVVKMLVIVILLFAICWGPTVTDDVLTAFGYLERYNYGDVKYVRQAFSLMSYANSCVNPIVYAFMSKNFRQSFKAALWSCVPGHSLRSQQRNSTMMHQMREVSVSYAPSTSFSKRESPPLQQRDWTTYKLIPAADSGADTEAEL